MWYYLLYCIVPIAVIFAALVLFALMRSGQLSQQARDAGREE